VSLKTVAENVCLSISIEGQTFKGREAFAESVLKDIKSRVASIHGHLSILPLETGGTVITVLVAR
jgi:signal transduction histidine kinase